MATSWLRVRYKGDQPPWAVKEVPGQGLAAFSTRKFNAGDLICIERPTTWVPGHHPFDEEQLAQIDERVAALAEDERDAFYAMSNAFPDAASPAAGIFMTNCFDMADAPHGESCAMYLAIARLNHSCTPNVQQTHLPDTGEEVLYAARDIEEGEELNDCYIDLRQSTAARQAVLLDIYRFTCTCAACSLVVDVPGMEKQRADDDRRRARAAALDDDILHAVSEDGPETALALAADAIRLLGAKECKPWSIRYLADALVSVYQLELANGAKERKARRLLKTAHELNVLLTGRRSPESQGTADKLGITLEPGAEAEFGRN